MNLLVQFTKPANIYFLLIAILQVIPSISLSGAMPTVAIPLTFVVIANMIKDGVEDYKRHVSDEKENSQIVGVLDLTSGALKDVKWKSVKVGDVVALLNNGPCPADIVLLASSEKSGVAFIETSNLDGETNLKLKTVPKEMDSINASGEQTAKAGAAKLHSQLTEARFRCQLPNNALYQFEGSVQIATKDIEAGQAPIALSPHNVILRGCRLRNTEWVLGAVVYTGHETKIQMNSREAPRKLSSLESLTEKFIWISFWIQLVLCIIGALVWGLIANSTTFQNKEYLGLTGVTSSEIAGKAVLKFFSYMILFSNFIPISLMVTMAIVKLFQSQLIQADASMDKSAVVRTSDLNEELGQIEFVFSDKTGTLTQNRMEFRKACISGISYGEGTTEIKRNLLKKLGEPVPDETAVVDAKNITPHVNFVDPRLAEIIKSRQPSGHFNDITMFFFSLAVNNTVMIESGEDSAFSASSPDEGALAYGAKHFAFTFLGRDARGVAVKLPDGQKLFVEQLASFDFDSVRKRSSLVCRCLDPVTRDRSKTFLFIKGADSVIVPRLSKSSSGRAETQKMLEEMEQFALDGLRTLCIGFRELGDDGWTKDWLKRYSQASVSLENREQQLELLADEIEKEIELLGISAIEDKLQADVGDTIDALRAAGIKVWMLTGDKLETAINIGLATSLIKSSGMYRVVLGARGEDMKRNLEITKNEFESVLGSRDQKIALPHSAIGASEVALIVQGQDLGIILRSDELKHLFGEITCMCASVIACRVSPEQKGAVVSLIREKFGKVTLAVGDGANDCNMIQSANVGVGIKGVEGRQAFNASDYGISEFRFLRPLLLVHGRWAYRRIAKLILYIFYKNVVIVLPSYFLNVVVSLFSGQRLFEEILYQLFNVVFTASPIIIFGVFEQDITKKDCLEFPQLYKVGPDKVHATRRTFVQWLLTGVWHSICVFFIPYLVMCKTQIIDQDGIPSDIWLFGSYVYLSIVVVVNLKLIMESYYLNAVLMSGIFVSVGLWFFSLYILEIMPQIFSTNGLKPENVNLSPSLAGVSKRLYTSPMTFFVILITCVTALLRDFIFKAFRFRFRARDYHLLMASLSKKGKEARPETKMPRTAISGTKDLAVFTEADPTSTLVLSSPTVKQSGKASRLSGILTPTPFRSRASSLAPVH